MAADVMRMAEPQVQRACACGGGCPACEAAATTLLTKPVTPGSRGPLSAPASVHQALASSGAPLDSGLRSFMEPRFGRDFTAVRVHTGSAAEKSARDVRARAYTVGQDIVFGRGQYEPGTADGRELIAHELAHVLQQDTGRIRRKPLKPLTADEKAEDLQSDELRDDDRLEKAFDNAPVLKKNETSEGVKTLQRALKDLDYPLPISFEKTGDADGIFGDETLGQVQQFQRDNELPDDGVVDRDTLRTLDDKFNPRVTIDRVYIRDDRRELIDNRTDWSASGPRFVDWANSPYHIKFSPGHHFNADAIPVTMPAEKTIQAIARVKVRGGIPGHTYTIMATPTDTAIGWTLAGTETHKNGRESDGIVVLSGEAPTPKKIGFQDTFLLWDVTTDKGTDGFGMSRLEAFITSGAAFKSSETTPDDSPNVPTYKRMRQAVKLADGADVGEADKVVYQVFRLFPNYGVCDVPDKPNPYNFPCRHLKSLWEMSDFPKTGNFQCITIARYANALVNVLGVPRVVQDISIEPVVIWATEETREEGIESPGDHLGLNIPSRVHPRHRDWALGLIDGRCGVNNYEACVKLKWTPPGQTKAVTQYYCGGLGKANPPEGFKTPRQVLNTSFVLAYFVDMAHNDPVTGFPRGIRKEDVKVYAESGKCRSELP
jgi:peptidoglycan hydrolase-like protein with peptidoglycan-binding domain